MICIEVIFWEVLSTDRAMGSHWSAAGLQEEVLTRPGHCGRGNSITLGALCKHVYYSKGLGAIQSGGCGHWACSMKLTFSTCNCKTSTSSVQMCASIHVSYVTIANIPNNILDKKPICETSEMSAWKVTQPHTSTSEHLTAPTHQYPHSSTSQHLTAPHSTHTPAPTLQHLTAPHSTLLQHDFLHSCMHSQRLVT